MKTYTISSDPAEINIECSDGSHITVDYRDDEAVIHYHTTSGEYYIEHVHPEDAMAQALTKMGIL